MWSRLLVPLYAAVIALWVLAFLRGAAGAITVFDGPLWDGPFQHYNALRRIAAGQVGGVDFQFYHGLGVPYLHYPIYRLFGGDVYASECARFLVNLLAYVLPYPLVFYAATRRWTHALGLTAVALVLSEPLGLHHLAWPTHNTPGVRATAPYLMLALLLTGLRPGREAVLGGMLVGCAFVLGTEHGIATGLMLGVVCAGRWWVGQPGGRGVYLLAAAAVGLVTAGGLLVAVGGFRGAAAALRYAFVNIPADQFWYFGTPTLPYLGSWDEVFADQRMLLAYGAAATQVAVLLAWARQSPTGRAVGPPLVGALAYGVAAAVGYLSYTGYQFHLPLIRVELTVALVVAWRGVDRLRAAEPARFTPGVRALQVGFAVTALVAGPLQSYGPSSAARAPEAVRAVADGGRTLARGEGRLSDRLAEHLAELVRAVGANRTRPGPPVIWSEYAGLLEAHFGVFHPSHDYLIHARGSTGSADYLAAFRAADPEFVFAFHGTYWPHVEKQHATDWGFYEELFENYRPVARTSFGHLWARLPGPWRAAPDAGWAPVPLDTEDAFTLPARPAGAGGDPVLVVEVRYEVRRPGLGFVPVLGQTPRHLLVPFGCQNQLPIPARPYADQMTFPVRLRPNAPAHFFAAVRSLVGGRWVLTGVRVRPLGADAAGRYLSTLR